MQFIPIFLELAIILKYKMKSLKRKFRIFGNFLLFILVAPEYTKKVKYESPKGLATLVSFFIWYSLGAFLLGSFFKHFNSLTPPHWFLPIANNPNAMLGRPFIWAIVLLSSFYLQATLRDLWDIKEIKKDLQISKIEGEPKNNKIKC